MTEYAAPSPGKSGSVSAASTAAYAVGSLGTGVFSTVPTVLLLYYCTETLLIPAALAGLLVFAPKAWAIIWDPLVGAWSDRTRSPWGRRTPFLLIGAIGVAAGFVALFSAPDWPLSALAWWVGIAYFFLATIYSIYAVPYIALPAEVARSDNERASLVSWRMVMAMTGVFIGAAVAPSLVSAFGGGRGGYASMSWVVGAVCLVAMLAPLAVAPGRSKEPARTASAPIWRATREALRAKGFAALAGSYFLQITSVGVLTASMPYLVSKVLMRPESDIGVALAALIGGSVVTPPLWNWLGRKLGEKTSLFAAIVFFAASTAGAAFAVMGQLSWPAMLCVFAASGVAFAGLSVLPFSMLAHLAHRERTRTGAALEATYTGLWTASEKLGLAFGPALVAAALALGGDGAVSPLVAIAPALMLTLAAALLARA
jgi:Na+/melibiose symporter-like transporter